MNLQNPIAHEETSFIPAISAQQVRHFLTTKQEIALIDLREEDAFARAHPLFAVSLPLSRLEAEIFDRVPRRDTLIALYDDGEGLIVHAASRLAALGYSRIHALDGGLDGWRQAGFELFQDVNSASKAFGELVEACRGTPHVTSAELKQLIDDQADIVILDARRFVEYRTMSIPTGISVPGAELVLRARDLAPDPQTTIVVNCAGRTRSIIGTQSLINAGLPNPIKALRNGTIGWTLSGLTLDHGKTDRFGPLDPDRARTAAQAARDVSYRAGVRHIDKAGLIALGQETTRTLYRFDVRTPEEYEAGHISGFKNAPGGQLVQETDVFAPVRGARIILADDLSARADMTASWLAQMAWDVYVLDGGFDEPLETGFWQAALPPLPPAPAITAQQLADKLARNEVTLIDLAPSSVYRQGHIPEAWFAVRAHAAEVFEKVSSNHTIVLTSPDGFLAAYAVEDFGRLSQAEIFHLEGGTNSWKEAGLPLEDGMLRAATKIDDIYRRPYEGTDNPVAAMEAYLEWEYGLVEQLARDASHGFVVI